MQAGKANKKELSAPTQVVGIPTPIVQCPPDAPGVIHLDQNRTLPGGFTSTRDFTALSTGKQQIPRDILQC